MPWYRLLYNLAIVPALALAAPFYVAKRGRSFRDGFARMCRILPQRLGKLPDTLPQGGERPLIWIHAVSVGESAAARPLVTAIRERLPECRVVVSTVTDTGQESAQQAPGVDGSFYLPMDHSLFCRRAMHRLKPAVLVILETEIWPGLYWSAADRNVPIVIVNGRISDLACGRFRRFSWFFRHVLSCTTRILAQSDRDRDRFIQAGAPEDRVHVMGNLKYDGVDIETAAAERETWRERLAVGTEGVLLAAGSTFEAEEALLGDIYLTIKAQVPQFRLLIAPRHVQRADSIVQTLEAKGISVVRRSNLETRAITQDDLILLDTTGELARVYGAADMAFLGKSLAAHETGGQNPVEPAAVGIPVCFGPNMQNFRAIAELLLEADGATRVRNAGELSALILSWIGDPGRRRAMGANAERCIAQQRGATQRAADAILDVLQGSNPPLVDAALPQYSRTSCRKDSQTP